MKKIKNTKDPNFWAYARSFLHIYLPKIRNLSPNTIESYKQAITLYINYLKSQLQIERHEITFDCFNRQMLKDYVIWMFEIQNWAAKTCNLRITAIKSFLEYCADEDITLVSVYNDVCSIRGLKEHKKPIKYMSNEAIQALLKTPKTNTKKGKRNRMMFVFLYDTAARAQELVDVTLRDMHIYNVRSPFVTLTGKGSKSRNVPLMDRTLEHLKLYLQEFHPDMDNASDRPLFYSMRDRKPHALSTDSINLLLKNYSEQAKLTCSQIPQHVHCHLIRKTRAMNLYQQGVPLSMIMELLGHESMSTTSNFYAFATVDMIHDAIKKTTPTAVKEVPIWKNKDFSDILYNLD
jgi:site-specific recombinase XerD